MLICKKDVLVVLEPILFGKPLNHSKKKSKIILSENSSLDTDQKYVSEVFNTFFHKYCR